MEGGASWEVQILWVDTQDEASRIPQAEEAAMSSQMPFCCLPGWRPQHGGAEQKTFSLLFLFSTLGVLPDETGWNKILASARLEKGLEKKKRKRGEGETWLWELAYVIIEARSPMICLKTGEESLWYNPVPFWRPKDQENPWCNFQSESKALRTGVMWWGCTDANPRVQEPGAPVAKKEKMDVPAQEERQKLLCIFSI